MEDAYIIAEVLTSSDYMNAAACLEEHAIAMFNDADKSDRLGMPSVSEETRVGARKVAECAARFRRVAKQVREQEVKAHG